MAGEPGPAESEELGLQLVVVSMYSAVCSWGNSLFCYIAHFKVLFNTGGQIYY